MSKKTAVIVGATGSIGRELVPLAASSPHYEKLVILHRCPTQFAGLPKVEERIIDFAKLESVASTGAVAVFCCIGTTQKKAGSTEAFQEVDRGIPVALARWAAANGAATFVTVSSLGADPRSKSVYLRTKGEMEEGVAEGSGAVDLHPEAIVARWAAGGVSPRGAGRHPGIGRDQPADGRPLEAVPVD